VELRQQYPNGAHEAFSDLSAHASRRLLWLGFEVHYLALLVVCRIGRIQPDHPPLSTFNIQAGSALGMPAEAPTIAAALKAMGYATGARKPAAGNKRLRRKVGRSAGR